MAPQHHGGQWVLHEKCGCSCLWDLDAILPCPPQSGTTGPFLCATNLSCKVAWAERAIALEVGEAGKVSTASSSATAGVRLWQVVEGDPESVRALMGSSQANGSVSFGEICGGRFMKCIGSHAGLHCSSEELSNRHRMGTGGPGVSRPAATRLLPLQMLLVIFALEKFLRK